MYKYICFFLLLTYLGNSSAESRHPFLSEPVPTMDFIQLSNGVMLMARHDGLYSFDGHTEKHIVLSDKDNTPFRVQTIFQQSNETIWVGSKGGGVFLLNNDLQVTQHFDQESHGISNHINAFIADHEQVIWVATDDGLAQINKDYQVTIISLASMEANLDNQKVNQLARLSDHSLAIGTPNGLYVFDKTSNLIQTLNQQPLLSGVINALSVDHTSMWVGTDTGLYQIDLDTRTVTAIKPQKINSRVMTIKHHGNSLWLGMLGAGLIELEPLNDFHLTQYTSTLPHTFLQDNTISSVYIDQAENLWLGTFNKGIQVVSLKTFGFYQSKAQFAQSDCFNNETTYGFHQIDIDQILILQSNGVLRMNTATQQCDLIHTNVQGFNLFDDNVPLIISPKQTGSVWLGTLKGLMELNLTTGTVKPVSTAVSGLAINFIFPASSNTILVGTYYGLYEINTDDMVAKKLSTGTPLENARYTQIILGKRKPPIFLTDLGLFSFNDSAQLFSLDSINKHLTQDSSLVTFTTNQQGHLVLVSDQAELLLFDDNHELVEKFQLPIDPKKLSILSIEQDHHGNYWMGTNNGLLHYAHAEKKLTQLTASHGLASNYFLPDASEQLFSGNLVFGGKNGFDMFSPEQINIDSNPNQLMLTNLYRFNKAVVPKQMVDGFSIDQAIDGLKQLNLSHRDYIISIEFNALNYIQPQLYSYFYQLVGFDPEWNLSGPNNQATYTNLPDGDYEFKVYYSDPLGLTKSQVKTLAIHVSPPPWLTWWAILAYIFTLLLLVYAYVQWKTRNNIRVAKMLRFEVAEKTKELHTQKSTVESLLMKKNELFSHVSHEFRTPLTLILGPIKELIGSSKQENDTQTLKMINRNANRLLSLVEQLLQLARISDLDEVRCTSQQTQSQIQAIVNSFQHLAQAKKINLILKQNDQANIHVSEQCIDAILGNLLSNAIKYTPIRGQVVVRAETTPRSFIVRVQDTGKGFSERQKREIFKRFKRLESHQDIDGIGIGLSVVEEVVKINHGEIIVESTVGSGSEFIVALPLADEAAASGNKSISSLIKQLSSEIIPPENQLSNQTTVKNADASLNTVLIIEDNHDMLKYIISIVSPHYHCLSAVNGRLGVTTAIEQVPDLIISDVMMPEMDGFQVSKVIRSDQRTSHIPLILLTALNDKVSRIKGWREHVDAYMTKPFDRDELLVQVENMLVIRDILKSKAGELLKKGEHTSLPKQDQLFINKFTDLIKDNYQNPLLSRTELASAMAVSERQLQRKVKALIDQNPRDMVRDYRLMKACESLKDSYQVSQVADDCGFNSLSYFSQCFKAQFGLSPKQYQSKVNERKK